MTAIINTGGIFEWFGTLGWIELVAALVVAFGCIGELWLLINKLTLHIEPIGKTAGRFWRAIALVDSKLRPLLVRLKINGRKIAKPKEDLLERMFVTLVALGVTVEFVCIPFSLNEVADLNIKAGQANERAANTESNSITLSLRVEELRKANDDLKSEIASPIPPRTINELRVGWPLRHFGSLKAAIIFDSSKVECASLASQLSLALRYALWKVEEFPTLKPIERGISVGVCSTNENFVDDNSPMDAACGLLVEQLNAEGVNAVTKNQINTTTSLRFNGVLIVIGSRPNVFEMQFNNESKRQKQIRDELGILSQQNATNWQKELALKDSSKTNLAQHNLLKELEQSDNVNFSKMWKLQKEFEANRDSFIIQDMISPRFITNKLTGKVQQHFSFGGHGGHEIDDIADIANTNEIPSKLP